MTDYEFDGKWKCVLCDYSLPELDKIETVSFSSEDLTQIFNDIITTMTFYFEKLYTRDYFMNLYITQY